MRKLISVLAAAAIAASASVSVLAAKTFPDVENDSTVSWARTYINSMVEKGYISGYEDGTYKPYNSVTRLEMLALMARVIGCNDSKNDTLIESAVEKYESMLKPFELPWGQKEISWLLYRGVITETDLTTYLKGTLKSEPMMRYEAAVIMTKAMGAEEAAKNSTYTLTYNDATQIPASVRQYVKYVTEEGLMSGMDGGNFSPNTSVVRSQMAVILSRIDEALGLEYYEVNITDVDEKSVTYIDDNNKSNTIDFDDNAKANIAGEPSKLTDIPEGIAALITVKNGKAYFIDTLTSVPDDEFQAVYVAKVTSNTLTRITVKRMDNDVQKIYNCASGLSVTYDGSPATLASFSSGDYVTVTLRNNEITQIDGQPKTITISSAKLTDFEYDPVVKLTIEHANKEYDGKTYYAADNVTVIKNGMLDKSLADLYIGDTLTLTLEYGKITAISASSTKASSNGVIKSITFAANSTMVVTVNGTDTEYDIPNEVKITVDGKEATMYDLRVGSSVSITTESNAITAITTTAAQSSSGTITGVVTAVNTSFGFVKVSYTNADGYTIEETVYCKDSTTTIMNTNAVTKKMKDITVGSTITATGTSTNGAFSAKVLIIE